MERYKQAIEAIVGPLCACERMKNNLRRELWAHFCALAEEERAAARDEAAAHENAVRRLGSPAEIRRAFMQDISKVERAVYAFDRWLRCVARRRGGWLLALLASAEGLVFAAILILGLEFPGWFEGRHGANTWVFYAALFASMTGCEGGLIVYALRHLESLQHLAKASALQGRLTKELVLALLRSAAMGCAFAIACGGFGWVLLALDLGWQHYDTLAFARIAPWLLMFAWGACSCTLLYAIPREAFHAQPIAGWPYAEE